MTAGAWRCCAAVAALLLPLLASALPAGAQETPAERIERILADSRYQRALPVPDPAPRLPAEPRVRPVEPREPSSFEIGPVLWVLGAAAVAVLLFQVAMLLRRTRPITAAETEQPAAAPAPRGATPTGPLADADRLAAAGNWAEAIHLLLLHGVEALKRRLGRVVPPALTSRELVRRVALPEPSAAALGAIVAAVERSRFGGRPVGPEDYRACRGHYQAFLDHAAGSVE